MVTRQHIIRDVLEDLGVAQADEPVAQADADLVSRRISRWIERMNRRQVFYAVDADEFDDSIAADLTDVIVQVCAPAFGRPRDMAALREAEASLRTMARLGKGIPGARLKVDRSLLGASRRQGRL